MINDPPLANAIPSDKMRQIEILHDKARVAMTLKTAQKQNCHPEISTG